MNNFYRFCLLPLFFAGAFLASSKAFAQCPVDRAVSPATVTICEGSTVSITVTSAQNNIAYRLQNNANNAPLSGFFLGDGSNLVLVSTPLSSSVTMELYAINPSTLCAIDLTGLVTVTVNAAPTASNAGADFAVCGLTTPLAANTPAVGTGTWTKASGPGTVNFSNPNSPTATATVSAAGTYLFRWTIANGLCTSSMDEVEVTYRENVSIVTPPSAQAVCEGGTIVLSVTASGDGLQYEWFYGLSSLGPPSSTESTKVISNATNADQGNYYVNVTGTCNPAGVSSAPVLVTVRNNPVVATHPSSQSVCEGDNVSFTVDAGTTTTPTYQWQVSTDGGGSYNDISGGIYSGETTATLTLTGVPLANSGFLYRARVNNVCNVPVNSNVASLTVRQFPIISTPPAAQTVCEGQNASFSVAASGTGLSYQWRFNGVDQGLPGASPVFTVPAATTGDAGLYSVVVIGSCGTLAEVGATLTVNRVPDALASDKNICSGAATDITITNPNAVPLTDYTWTVQTANNVSGMSAGSGNYINQTLSTTSNASVGTVVYSIVPSAAGCSGSPFAVSVTVQPIPDATASDATICSGTSPAVAITNPNNVTGTTFAWTITASSNVSGALAGSGTTINQVLTSTDGINPGTVTYEITPTAGTCAGTPINVTVTVNPAPVITNTAAQLATSICSTQALNFTPTSTIGGTTYNWTATITGPINPASVTAAGSGAITDAPVNTGNVSGQVIYRITPSVGACQGAYVDYVVTVDPIPDAAASDATICSGTSPAIAITNPNNVTGTTFSWTITASSNVSGASAASGNIINQTLTATDGINPGTVTYQITPTAGTCAGTPINVTVTVNPAPVITNTAAQLATSICSTQALNFTPTSTIGGTTYSWTATITGPINPASVTAAGSGAITDSPVNTGNVSGQVIYRITPSVGACQGAYVDYVVTVNPIPDAAASDATICSGTSPAIAITNPNAVTGTTFAWTIAASSNVSGASAASGNIINQTLTATDGINPGTVTYEITPTAGACAGTPINVTVTVNPAPVITNTATQLATSICSTQALNFTPTSTIGGTTYNWTATITGPINPASVTAAGSGAITDAPVNTGNVSGQVIYRITPSVGACQGAYVDYVVTVNPIPDAAASDATICSGTSPAIAITNPNAVTGTTFAWTITASSNVSGASAASGNIINQTLTATDGINPGTVTYQITPTAGTCAGTPINVTVTVNPAPVITNTAAQLATNICSTQALNFTPTSTIGGTTYNWTATITGPINPASVTAAGSGAITDSPVNTGNVSGQVIYRITPSVGACQGAYVDYVVTVNPIPDAAASDATICSGTSPAIAITNPNAVTGTTFSWTVVSATNVSGASAASGNIINQTLTSTDGINPGTVTYQITPTAGTCAGTPITATVTVNPAPVITSSPSQLNVEICSNQPLNFTPASTIIGTTYNWTSTIVGSIDPSSVTASGSGAIMDIPANIGNVPGQVIYTITPAAGVCQGNSVNYVVTVNPLPSASVSDITICSGEVASLAITPAPQNVAGTTFEWVAIPNNVNGASGGNGSLIQQLLQTADANIGTVTYEITPWAKNCQGPLHTATVTVNPIATVNAGVDFEVCEPVSFEVKGFLGGAATSGTWTVVGASAGTLSASAVSGNEVTATYTIAVADVNTQITFRLTTNDPDAAGPCLQVSDDVVVRINRRAVVTLPADYTVCEPSSLNLTGTLSGSATSGLWSTTSPGALSTTSIVGPGPTFTATATYGTDASDVTNTLVFRLTTNDPDGSGPCQAEFAEIAIHINESAKVDAGADFAICDYDTALLSGSISGTATSALWTKPGAATGVLQNASALSTEFYHTKSDLALKALTFTLTTNDPDGAGPCLAASDAVVLTINKLDPVDLVNLAPTYAENDPPHALIAFPNDPDIGEGTFSGPGIVAASNVFDPGIANAGETNIITYTWENLITGCINSDSDTTIVNALTEIDFDIIGSTDFSATEIRVCRNAGNLWIKGTPGIHDPIAKESETRFESDQIQERLLQLFNTTTGATEYYLNTDGLDPNGFYTIRYVFTNELDVRQVLTKRIIVSASAVPEITMGPACLGDEVEFVQNTTFPPGLNPESDTVRMYTWDFGENGEGETVIAPVTDNPTYTYTIPGNHSVTLTVETEHGCRSSVTEVIRIGRKPQLDFEWSKICSGLETTEFLNKSVPFDGFSSIVEYQWDFGDGSPVESPGAPSDPYASGGTYQDPHHTFNLFQVYPVTMTARTDDECVDSITKQVYILSYETPLPTQGYSNDFEVNDASWIALPLPQVDPTNSWVWDVVNGSTITGSKAWWTGRNDPNGVDHATYYSDEKSEVVSPCLNLTLLERPMISFDYWSDSQDSFDGLVLQYTTNGGMDWHEVGDIATGAGINWYNTSFLSSSPGGQDDFAWSGRLGGWKTARFNLESIADRDLVVFRFAFASNNDNPKTGAPLEGFAIDNIYIGNKTRNVLVEHFTNVNTSPASRDYFHELYERQFDSRSESDFNLLSYHITNGGPDEFNENNPADPFARMQWYGVPRSSTALMDGIFGPYFATNFTGQYDLIDSIEVDRRALETPVFLITPRPLVEDNGRLTGSVKFQYTGAVADAGSKTFHAVLVEDSVFHDGTQAHYRNVMRKLLWQPEGHVTTNAWAPGDSIRIPIDFNMRTEVQDPSKLKVIVFVQDRTTRQIHQSMVINAPPIAGDPVTGVEEGQVLNNLEVYPIPASGTLHLRMDRVLMHDYEWQIIDQRGAELKKGRLNRDLREAQSIDIERLPNGIYFLRVQSSDRSVYYRKIAIMNRG